MTRPAAVPVLLVAVLVGVGGGCGLDPRAGTDAVASTPAPDPQSGGASAASESAGGPAPAPPTDASTPVSTPRIERPARTEPAGPRTSDGRPRPARLTIPALDIGALLVVPYRGRTDDGPGTRIQNRGVAASPHGPAGGTGPGGVGNYQVTAHRLSSTQAFRNLPDLRVGERVVVDAGGRRYVYRVSHTRRTSFRSAASLRRQRAAVPGRPGVAPTRAMITLSTCATPEDHAAGNWWSDRHGNPEHRIDKIGTLVRSLPA